MRYFLNINFLNKKGRSVKTKLVRNNEIVMDLFDNPKYDFNYQFNIEVKPLKLKKVYIYIYIFFFYILIICLTYPF